MNVSPLTARTGAAAAAALLTGISLVGCQAKESETPASSGANAPAQITVNASDTTCELSGTEGTTGPSTFVITNNGTKVTEFYVYGAGDRVMGEVENISPRTRAQARRPARRAGQVPDRVQAGHDRRRIPR